MRGDTRPCVEKSRLQTGEDSGMYSRYLESLYTFAVRLCAYLLRCASVSRQGAGVAESTGHAQGELLGVQPR